MQQNTIVNNSQQDPKLRARQAKKKLKILITIGVLMLALFIIVFVASIRHGGFSNLLKGDKDPISNTINNIGTSFTDNSPENKQPKPVSLPSTPQDKKEVTTSQTQNYMAFDTFSPGEYEITIKKNTFVYFTNRMETRIGLQFSDGRDLKLNGLEEKNMKFPNPGTYTFTDVLDRTGEPITGTIHVLNE